MITCNHCSGSGKYISYGGVYGGVVTTGNITGGAVLVDCKYCSGNGYIDENEIIINVPRKHVRDSYFD